MKITKQTLQKIIKEELANVLNEGYGPEWYIENVGGTLNRWLRAEETGNRLTAAPRETDLNLVADALAALGAKVGGPDGPVWGAFPDGPAGPEYSEAAHEAVAAIGNEGLNRFMKQAALGAKNYEWEGKPIGPARPTGRFFAKKEKEPGVDHTAGGAGNFPASRGTRTDWTKRGRG